MAARRKKGKMVKRCLNFEALIRAGNKDRVLVGHSVLAW